MSHVSKSTVRGHESIASSPSNRSNLKRSRSENRSRHKSANREPNHSRSRSFTPSEKPNKIKSTSFNKHETDRRISTKSNNLANRLPECICGPNLYGNVLGPTVDEPIILGLATFFAMCDDCPPESNQITDTDSTSHISHDSKNVSIKSAHDKYDDEGPEDDQNQTLVPEVESSHTRSRINEESVEEFQASQTLAHSSHPISEAKTPTIHESVALASVATTSSIESKRDSAVLTDFKEDSGSQSQEPVQDFSQTTTESQKIESKIRAIESLGSKASQISEGSQTSNMVEKETNVYEISSNNASYPEPSYHSSQNSASEDKSSKHSSQLIQTTEPSHHSSHHSSAHESAQKEPSFYSSHHSTAHEPSHHSSHHSDAQKEQSHVGSHHSSAHESAHKEPSHHSSHHSSTNEPSHHSMTSKESSHHNNDLRETRESFHPSAHRSTLKSDSPIKCKCCVCESAPSTKKESSSSCTCKPCPIKSALKKACVNQAALARCQCKNAYVQSSSSSSTCTCKDTEVQSSSSSSSCQCKNAEVQSSSSSSSNLKGKKAPTKNSSTSSSCNHRKAKKACPCSTSTTRTTTTTATSLGDVKSTEKEKAKAMGDTKKCEIRYAITKITKFCSYTTFEVMKSTKKKPKTLPKTLEGVFVLRNKKNCG